MNEQDKLHMWYKPYGGVVGDTDLAFLDRYGRRFYPKSMGELSKHIHRLAVKITQQCPQDAFEYSLTHYTRKDTNRYVIEESLREAANINGLSLGIQATNVEERRLFTDFARGDEEAIRNTQPVQNVIAYLEDSFTVESNRWENIKMHNGQDAMPVLKDIIGFLKQIKNLVRVYHFELAYNETGHVLSIVLLSPGVQSYYTRIDWTIV